MATRTRHRAAACCGVDVAGPGPIRLCARQPGLPTLSLTEDAGPEHGAPTDAGIETPANRVINEGDGKRQGGRLWQAVTRWAGAKRGPTANRERGLPRFPFREMTTAKPTDAFPPA